MKVADFIDAAADIACDAKAKTKKLADYRAFLLEDEAISFRIAKLKGDVEEFARLFPMPGHADH